MTKHIKLNKENPNNVLNVNSLLKDHAILVKFYSDTCGHCHQMQPDWEDASKRIHSKNPQKLAIVEVEASNMHNFQDDEEIKSKIMGFPTIMYLNKKNKKVQVIPYNGSRTSDDFVDFTFKNLKNSVNVAKSRKSKKQNKKNNKTKNNGKKRKSKSTKKNKKPKKK